MDAEFLQDMTADEAQPLIRFKCKVGDRQFEEVLTYHRMLEWVEQDATTDKDDFYRLVGIHGHRRKQNRQWEVKVEWASGKILWNDMNTIFRDDPVTLSMYARKHNLLNTDGWRWCK